MTDKARWDKWIAHVEDNGGDPIRRMLEAFAAKGGQSLTITSRDKVTGEVTLPPLKVVFSPDAENVTSDDNSDKE